MKLLAKYILIIFVVLLGLSGLVAFFETPIGQTDTISLSQVVEKINNGEAKEISIQGSSLKIKAGDKTFKSKKEIGVSAVETLLNLGADKAKLSALDV